MRRLLLFGILAAGLPVILVSAPQTHTVKEGETLYGIARSLGVDVQKLSEYNDLRDPSKVRAGLVLKIPGTDLGSSETYTVQKGDTFYGISRSLGVDLRDLLTWNNKKETSILKAGEKLTVFRSSTSQDKPASTRDGATSLQVTASGTVAVESRPAGVLWPHNGAMKNLSDKLGGVAFEGTRGDSVYSISSGEVVWIGPYRGYGKVVFVQNKTGYIYVYAGNEEVTVKQGDLVRPGVRLGTLGINPYEQKSTLFFVVYRDGKPVNPKEAPRV